MKNASIEYERLKELIHAETQIEMIKATIDEQESFCCSEDILEAIKVILRI